RLPYTRLFRSPTSAWAGEGARTVPVSRTAEAMDTTRRRARRAAPVLRFLRRAEWGIGCVGGMETSFVKERGGYRWADAPLPSGGSMGGWGSVLSSTGVGELSYSRVKLMRRGGSGKAEWACTSAEDEERR